MAGASRPPLSLKRKGVWQPSNDDHHTPKTDCVHAPTHGTVECFPPGGLLINHGADSNGIRVASYPDDCPSAAFRTGLYCALYRLRCRVRFLSPIGLLSHAD